MGHGGGRAWLFVIGVALLLMWPLRWLWGAMPASLYATHHGTYLATHMLAEALAASACLWAASPGRRRRGPLMLHPAAARLALGLLGYGAVNGLGAGVRGDTWSLATAGLQLAGVAILMVWALDEPVLRSPAVRWAGTLMMLLGAGILGFWGMFIATGGLTAGLRTVESEAYIAFHIAAEALAAAGALRSGGGLFWRVPGSAARTLVACGMLLYSTVASFGWGLLNDPTMAVVFGVSAAITVTVAAVAWRPVARRMVSGLGD